MGSVGNKAIQGLVSQKYAVEILYRVKNRIWHSKHRFLVVLTNAECYTVTQKRKHAKIWGRIHKGS